MATRKNLVFIIADDHRYESLGSSGNTCVETPNLDALAERGTRFTGAHCQGSMHPAVCVPSRASLLTGRNIFASSADPTGSAYEGEAFVIPAHLRTFPEILRSQGYLTYAIGKWHNDKASFARSFSDGSRIMFGGMSDHDRVPLHDFDPSGEYPPAKVRFEDGLSTDLFTDSAKSFLETRDPGRPFCLYIAYTAPHDPRTPPPQWVVPAEQIELPRNYLPVHPFDNGEMTVRDELLEAFPRTPEAIRQHIADYYGMIRHLDAAIGDVVEALQKYGLLDETIVVYTADHGLALGQHGLLGKQNLYEHSLRLPLIIAGPGVPAGGEVDQLAWHADTHATTLALLGAEPAATCEGNDLFDGSLKPRDHLFGAYRYGQRMVRDRRYKLIRYHQAEACLLYNTRDGSGTAGSETVQLFDLEVDPFETVNIVSFPGMEGVARTLDSRLRTWQEEVGDPILDVENHQPRSSPKSGREPWNEIGGR